MLSKRQRFVGVFEFTVRPARQPDYPVALEAEDFEKLQAAVLAARAQGKVLVELADDERILIALDDLVLSKNDKIVSLLFTVVDADAADVVYRNMKTYDEKIFKKEPEEGGAASAHLVINLAAAANSNRYRAGLEDVEGVTRTRITNFLQRLFRDYCGEVRYVSDDEELSADAVVEFQPVHEEKLKDAAGRPVSVQLVSLQPRKRLDDATKYRESRRTVEFVIDRKISEADARAAVFSIRKQQETSLSDYPLMRISWQRPDEKIQTLRVDTLADDLMQRAFTSMKLITDFREDLLAATTRVRPDVVDKIRAAIA